MRSVILVALVVLATAACGGSDQGSGQRGSGDSLTQRQRDSILSQSSIPGARGVGRAMSAADSASARVQAGDTIGP
ncbi:MAG: hypothetical protein ACREMF_10685 [Gemmatimonadales bacterium]